MQDIFIKKIKMQQLFFYEIAKKLYSTNNHELHN